MVDTRARPSRRTRRLLPALALGALALAGCGSSGAGAQPPLPPSASPAPSAPPAIAGQTASPAPAAASGAPATVHPTPSVPAAGRAGTFTIAPAAAAPVGRGAAQRYLVEVETATGIDPAGFAAAVEATLGDPRSWIGDRRLALHRVSSGPVSFRVVLATPATTDRLCRPLITNGIFSCFQGDRAVINLKRWTGGAAAYGQDLPSYRHYVINHEVGHALGRGHVGCPGAGRPAPVMMQQTKGLGGCRPNPWPSP